MKHGQFQKAYRGMLDKLLRRIGVSVLTVIVSASLAGAADPVTISSLLADPTGYNMRLVRVEGMVVNLQMQHFIGNVSKLEKCVQRFLVKDDTGAMQAVYTTICPNDSLLKNGDRVTVEAHFSGVLEVRSLTKK
jgi:cytochrome c-type biogenesis protein CcmE